MQRSHAFVPIDKNNVLVPKKMHVVKMPTTVHIYKIIIRLIAF